LSQRRFKFNNLSDKLSGTATKDGLMVAEVTPSAAAGAEPSVTSKGSSTVSTFATTVSIAGKPKVSNVVLPGTVNDESELRFLAVPVRVKGFYVHTRIGEGSIASRGYFVRRIQIGPVDDPQRAGKKAVADPEAEVKVPAP